jgi:putative intracellular protease/amidase
MRTLRVAILVFDDFEPIDVWGFAQAFTIARFLGTRYSDPPPYPFEVSLVARERKPVRSYNGPLAMPNFSIADAETFDVLMIPGGEGIAAVLKDDTLLAWVKAMDGKVELMTSVCTGAAVLAKLDLLDGKRAATNHGAFDWVRTFGPNVLWDNVARWCDAGRYVTSAGVSAGTDMGFYLVSRLAGRAVAENAALSAEYNWQRNPY